MALQLAQVSVPPLPDCTIISTHFRFYLPQLGLTSDDISDENAEAESATSSDALFENRNVWLKGMRGMVQHLSADAEQVWEKEN